MKRPKGVGRRMRLSVENRYNAVRVVLYVHNVARLVFWPTDMHRLGIHLGLTPQPGTALDVRLVESPYGRIKIRGDDKGGVWMRGIYMCKRGFERATGLTAPKTTKQYALVLDGGR